MRDNRKALGTDVRKLSRILKTIDSERANLDTALAVAPVAIGNLVLAYNTESGTIGSRITLNGNVQAADQLLCSLITFAEVPNAVRRPACALFDALVGPVAENVGPIPPPSGNRAGALGQGGGAASRHRRGGADHRGGALRHRRRRRPRPPAGGGAMTRRPMRRPAQLVVGLLSASLLLSGCDFDGAYDLPLPGSPVDADEAYEVTAEFDDVLSVVPRSPVMVDDVVVGEVIEVERSDWHAVLTLRVRDDVRLGDNAVAEIRQVSLLGEKYVALEDPTGTEPTGQLGEGDTITLDRTGRNPEVEEVLGALSFLLSGGGVAQLGTITRELNLAMSGREPELRDLLGSLESFVGTLDEQKGDIISALESINNLTSTLNRERTTIEDALDVTGPAIRVLADQHRELVGMLTSLDRLGVVGTRVIGASKDDLLRMLRDLAPVLANLRRAGDQLGPGLNLLVSFPFPKEASEIVQGDFANTSIKADINLDNFLSQVPDGPEIPGIPDLPDIPVDLPAAAHDPRVPHQRDPAEPALRPRPGVGDPAAAAAAGLPAARTAAEPGVPRAGRRCRHRRRWRRRWRRRRRRRGRSTRCSPTCSAADARPPVASPSCSGVPHDPWRPDPARDLRRALGDRHRLHGGQLPRSRRQGAGPWPHRPRHAADVRRPLRGQRGHLPRRQDRPRRADVHHARRHQAGPGSQGRHRAARRLRDVRAQPHRDR